MHFSVTEAVLDGQGSVTPGDTILRDGRFMTITDVVIHPPGEPHPPILDELYAIEIVADNGSRWVGAEWADTLIGRDTVIFRMP